MPGHRPGVRGTPGRPAGFQKLYVIFSYVSCLVPIDVERGGGGDLGICDRPMPLTMGKTNTEPPKRRAPGKWGRPRRGSSSWPENPVEIP